MNTMNVASKQDARDIPLCVDLDGTLIRTDLLFESVCLLARKNPLFLLMLPLWLYRGKAFMKAQIAKRIAIDASNLPYNEAVLDWLRAEKANGRRLVLATASAEPYAKAVAAHLGLFDAVYASNDQINLSSRRKARKLAEVCGEFDYVGNSADDLKVWDKSRRAIIVGEDKTARRYLLRDHAVALPEPKAERSRLRIWLKAIRIHQWLKNSLLFVTAILGSQFLEPAALLQLSIAFISFGFCASSVYLLNDLTDIEVDRRHPTKRRRPIPAGDISVMQAAVGSLALLTASLALSTLLPPAFTAVLALYYVITCAYSFLLKRFLLIDVLTLAGLFTIRVIAGAAALNGDVSTWLLAFCVFFFLSLALVKRFVELTLRNDDAGRETTGRGYQSDDLETLSQGGMASGFAAVVVLALFIDSPEVAQSHSHPELIWLVCPLVLYLIFRIWILARREQMNDDPVVFLMTDWRSQIMIATGAFIMIASQLV